MVLRGLAKAKNFTLGPTAPLKSFSQNIKTVSDKNKLINISNEKHALSNTIQNNKLYEYEKKTKRSFDNIVSTLKEIAYIQHNEDFLENAQEISQKNLGIDLPTHILDKSWVKPLDMRGLYAWCVFKQHEKFSDDFFKNDPLCGAASSTEAKVRCYNIEHYLQSC